MQGLQKHKRLQRDLMRSLVMVCDIHRKRTGLSLVDMFATVKIVKRHFLDDWRTHLRQQNITTGLIRERQWRGSKLDPRSDER